MRVFGLPWSFHPLAKYPPLDLAPEARDRLRALQLWADTGDVALVGRTFAISRATLYRWRAQFESGLSPSRSRRARAGRITSGARSGPRGWWPRCADCAGPIRAGARTSS